MTEAIPEQGIEYVELRYYPAGNADPVLLPNFTSASFDVKYNDLGALDFSYPLTDAKSIGLGDQVIIGARVGLSDGTTFDVERYVIESTNDDKVVDGKRMKQLSGRSQLALMDDAVVYPSNWKSITLSNKLRSNNVATITVATGHGFAVGQDLFVSVDGDSSFSGEVTVTAATATSLSYASTGPNVGSTAATGTVQAMLPTGHEFIEQTLGSVMRTLVARAKERGTLTSIDETTFTGVQDSSGAAWLQQTSQTYGTGTGYLSVLTEFMERGLADAWMTPDRKLMILNGGTRGSHIDIGTVEVRPASNVTEMATSTQSGESASAVLIEGEQGTALERNNPAFQSQLGRRRERYVSQGGVRDAGVLTLLGDAELEVHARIPAEETVGIANSGLAPFSDFNVGDWLWVRYETDEQAVERRVRQLAVSVDADRKVTMGMTLNSILYEADVALARKVESYTGSGGNYGPTPNSQVDNSVPNAPAGLTVTSGIYVARDGSYQGAFVANWAAPSANKDGSSPVSINHYDVQFKYSTDSEWGPVYRTSGSETTFGYSPVTPRREIDIHVRAVGTNDFHSDWSTTKTSTLAGDTDAPPSPSTPVVADAMDSVNVQWNGLTSTGAAMPSDFLCVEIWESPTSGFTPGVGDALLVGTMLSAGYFSAPGGLVGQTMYYKLRSVDRAGNAENISAEASGKKLGTDIDAQIATVNDKINTEISQTNTKIEQGDSANAQAIQTETQNRVNAVTNLANTVTQGDTANSQAIQTETQARVDALNAANTAREQGDTANELLINNAVNEYRAEFLDRPLPIRATTDPIGTAVTGQVWEKYDTLSSPRRLLAVWIGDGTEWIVQKLDPTYIPILDINSGTANSLAVQRLAISDFSNYFYDPRLERLAGDFGSMAYVTAGDLYSPPAGGNVLLTKTGFGGDASPTPIPPIPVSEGDEVVIEYDGKRVLGSGDFGLGLYSFTDGWVATSSETIKDYGSGWTRIRITYAVTSAKSLVLITYINHPPPYTDTRAVFSNISIHRRFGGELIVDGGIKAKNIDLVDLNASGQLIVGQSQVTGLGAALDSKESAGTAQQKADEAEAAAKAYTDSIEVGAVNLLSNGGPERTQGWRYISIPAPAGLDDIIGQQMTISYDGKATIPASIRGPYNLGGGTGIASGAQQNHEDFTTEWKRFSFTTTVATGPLAEGYTEQNISWYDENNASNVLSLRNVKIEAGSKATSWSPSQQDVANSISAAKSDAVTELKTLWGLPADTTLINGGRIATNSILAQSIALADFTNYVRDPDFSLDGWIPANVTPTYKQVTDGPPAGPEGAVVSTRVAQWDTSPGFAYIMQARLPVAPGDKFAGEFWCRNPSGGSVTMHVSWDDSLNQEISADQAGGYAGAEWTLFSGEFEVPANAVTVRIHFINWSTVGLPQVALPKFRRKSGGKLIVDGAIKAKNLDVDDINAAGTIKVGQLQVTGLSDALAGKETPAGAQEKANEAFKNAVLASSKINNFSVSENLEGWWLDQSEGLVDVDFNGKTIKALKTTTTGDFGAGHSRYFDVDPNKTYMVSVWIKHAGVSGPAEGRSYFGTYSNPFGVIEAVNPSDGALLGQDENHYFSYPLGPEVGQDWQHRVGYIFPTAASPSDMAGLGVNVIRNARMNIDTKSMSIRFLNFYNNGVESSLYVAHPTVTEIDIAGIAATKNAAIGTLTNMWGLPSDSTLINGGKIATKSIMAQSLALSDFTNYIADADFQALEFGSWKSASATLTAVDNDAINGRYLLVHWDGTPYNNHFSNSYMPSVTPEDEFFVTLDAYHYSTSSIFGFYVTFIDPTGTGISAAQPIHSTNHPEGWVPLSGTFTIPPNASTMNIIPYISGGDVSIRRLSLRRKSGGELIVDGSIKAIKIDTDDLNLSGALRVGQSQVTGLDTTLAGKEAVGVAASKVTALQNLWGMPTNTTLINGGTIATDSILAKSLVLQDTTNLWPDADFRSLDSYVSNPNISLEPNNAGGAAGVRGMRVNHTSGSYTTLTPIMDTLSCKEGDSFRIYAQCKGGVGVSGNVSFVIAWSMSDGSTTWSETPFPAVSAWATSVVSKMITVPYGVVGARWYLQCNSSATTGTYFFARPSVIRAATGELIVDGAIQAKHITADMVRGLMFTGTTADPAVFQTAMNGAPYGTTPTGIKINQAGLTAYSSTGVPTLTIDGATGSISMKGTLTSGSTISGATISGSSLTTATGSTGYTINLSQSNLNFRNSASQDVATLYADDNGFYVFGRKDYLTIGASTTGSSASASITLNSSSKSLYFGGPLGSAAQFDSTLLIKEKITGYTGIEITEVPGGVVTLKADNALRSPQVSALTSTSPANVGINTSSSIATFYRSTSIRAAKIAIEPMAFDTSIALLEVPVSTWFDRRAVETYAEALAIEDETERKNLMDEMLTDLRRIPGVVAEDVEEFAPIFTTRDSDGNLTGVAYDRIGVAWIPIVKDVIERLEALERKPKKLEGVK